VAVFQTARHELPMLAVSQARKEITHNEALVRIDALLHPLVEAVQNNPPALLTDADIGMCWLVAASPISLWTGEEDSLAIWIGGGWRFCKPNEGMQVRIKSGVHLTYIENAWAYPPAIADPANGSVVDAEARQAIASMLLYLRSIGYLGN
jgi:Protein of unknown function (DUF2793)